MQFNLLEKKSEVSFLLSVLLHWEGKKVYVSNIHFSGSYGYTARGKQDPLMEFSTSL